MPDDKNEEASRAEAVKRKAQQAGEAAKEKLEDLKEAAQGLAGEAGERVADEAERRRAGTGDQVAQIAEALTKAAESLDEGSRPREVFEAAADGMDRLASEIQGKSIGQLVGDASDFGRRHPAAFVGGAALLGFALSRFSTAKPLEDDSQGQSEQDAPETDGESAS